MLRKLGLLIVTFCFWGSVGLADQVVLKNGDSITGSIVKLTDSKLVFKSDLAGEVTIDLSDIRTLASDKLLTIHLKDGTVLKCQVAAGQVKMYPKTEMMDLVVVDGRARGIVTRDLVSGAISCCRTL